MSADADARLRAAQLQERLGFSVSAATSNDWQGAYCIVDFDSLESAVERERDLTRALADLLDTVERGDEHLIRERVTAAREALAGGASAVKERP